MQYNKILSNASFFILLGKIDRDLAEKVHLCPCQFCGDKVNWGNYPRKLRGIPETDYDHQFFRYSLCCRNDQCRRRQAVPSVLFHGRFVYNTLWLLLVAFFLSDGKNRIKNLQKHIAVDRRTLMRWKKYWHEEFPQSEFFKTIKSRIPSIYSMPTDFIKHIGSTYSESEFVPKLMTIFHDCLHPF